jgi:hypothetical protein
MSAGMGESSIVVVRSSHFRRKARPGWGDEGIEHPLQSHLHRSRNAQVSPLLTRQPRRCHDSGSRAGRRYLYLLTGMLGEISTDVL